MSEELEAIEEAQFVDGYVLSYRDYKLIKQALIDKDNLQSKLDKIEEEIGDKSVLYTNSIDKIKSILKESE